jgi:lipopolysaccharide/colanic/teichoic acid biosynthesis glycosyltransferase
MGTHRGFRAWIWSADLLWFALSIVLAWFLRYGAKWHDQPRLVAQTFALTLFCSALVWTILWFVLDLDCFRGAWRISAVTTQLLLAVMVVMGTLLTAGYLLRIYVSRLALAYFSIGALAGLILIRILSRAILQMRYRSGAVRRIVIVGDGPIAREAAAKIAHHPEMQCKVVGFLATQETSLEVLGPDAPANVRNVAGNKVLKLLSDRQVDELIFTTPTSGNGAVAGLMEQCVKSGVAVTVIPQPYELYLSRPELLDLDGLPLLRLRHSYGPSADPAWKRATDLVFAIPALIFACPLILGAAFWLKLKKGAGFCREERYGLHGERFFLYRLNSPRRTSSLPPYELVMQHLSITELPQLLNVIQGQMSLVGPRPEGFESIRHYTDWHRQRLNVKPGMTGLAQVHGMRDQHLLEDKTRYDLQYILRRSMFQDVSLLLQTFWTLGGRLAHLRKLRRDAPESRSEPTTSHSLPA